MPACGRGRPAFRASPCKGGITRSWARRAGRVGASRAPASLERPRWARLHAKADARTAAQVVASPEQAEALGPELDAEALEKMAHLRALTERKVAVSQASASGQVPLQEYLRLPIEQYFITDPSNMRKTGPSDFEFSLPRLRFFNVWVAPVVMMTVDVSDGSDTAVSIRASKCIIRGSPLVERMKLNDRLRVAVKTSLTSVSSEGGEGARGGEAQVLVARSELDVWCDIVPPFHLLPKQSLERTCSGVLQSTLSALLKTFLRKLAEDYAVWSTDEEHRIQRERESLAFTSTDFEE